MPRPLLRRQGTMDPPGYTPSPHHAHPYHSMSPHADPALPYLGPALPHLGPARPHLAKSPPPPHYEDPGPPEIVTPPSLVTQLSRVSMTREPAPVLAVTPPPPHSPALSPAT